MVLLLTIILVGGYHIILIFCFGFQLTLWGLGVDRAYYYNTFLGAFAKLCFPKLNKNVSHLKWEDTVCIIFPQITSVTQNSLIYFTIRSYHGTTSTVVNLIQNFPLVPWTINFILQKNTIFKITIKTVVDSGLVRHCKKFSQFGTRLV
jgi:hypothetical protein